VLVRKTRGPYAGLLDLPGGSPDPSDPDRTATLRRELAEEAGLVLEHVGAWYDFAFLCTRDSSGREIELRHSGVWAMPTVSYPRPACAAIGSSDTAGTVWTDVGDWRNRLDTSLLVQVVFADAENRGLLGQSRRDRAPAPGT
jgi:8-oxo-dGTP pyrophosphatase MutT (NUDIX family)